MAPFSQFRSIIYGRFIIQLQFLFAVLRGLTFRCLTFTIIAGCEGGDFFMAALCLVITNHYLLLTFMATAFQICLDFQSAVYESRLRESRFCMNLMKCFCCCHFRLRATLLQMPEFTHAFKCNSSSPLHHGKICGRII